MAKILGYQVATNTTVYKETDVKEIEQMFEFFSSLEVDAHTISPGYEYDAAKKDMIKRLGKQPEDFFLTRKMTREKFKDMEKWGDRFTIIGTRVYQEFLAGKRELTCTAWAIPTRNVRGWKAPCYLMTDGHYAGYHEMLEKVDWDKYGVVDGVARDPRCENCMVHCGYDPSGALSTKLSDTWKNMSYNFSAKPKPYYAGPLDQGLQRRLHRQGPSGRGQGGHQCQAPAAAAPATPPNATNCWRKLPARRRLDLKTLFLSPPSFDGFDGGAGSRYQARREVTSFWYPTWLAQPAALVPNSKLLDCPPHDIGVKQCLEIAREISTTSSSTPRRRR